MQNKNFAHGHQIFKMALVATVLYIQVQWCCKKAIKWHFRWIKDINVESLYINRKMSRRNFYYRDNKSEIFNFYVLIYFMCVWGTQCLFSNKF